MKKISLVLAMALVLPMSLFAQDKIQTNVDKIVFENVRIAFSDEQTVEVTTVGNSNDLIAFVEGEGFDVFQVRNGSENSNSTVQYTVVFRPDMAGLYTGVLYITNGGEDVAKVLLLGEAVESDLRSMQRNEFESNRHQVIR